jgi:tellurite resistance protein
VTSAGALGYPAEPMAAPTKPSSIEKHADAARKELSVPKQAELFTAAVEAGYLAALADGAEDAGERAALVKAIELLSTGLVLEWETEEMLAQCWARISGEGADARMAAVGATLKDLGYAEAGLFVAALVALASNGIDAKEAAVLEKIGMAAGVAKTQVGAIVKRARA